MEEQKVKQLLADYFSKNSIEFKHEVNLGGQVIDFLFRSKDKWFGVEVKGVFTRSEYAVGQLIGYFRFISHIYICAPKTTIRKIENSISANKEIRHLLDKFGIIVVDEGNVIFTKHPNNETHYFNITASPPKKSHYRPKYGILDEKDEEIISLIRAKSTCTISDIANNFGLSMEAARKRLRNLEHFRYVKRISSYPLIYTNNAERLI